MLRDYPEEAGWIRDHLLVSDALKTADAPSVERKSRARESILNAVARSDSPRIGANRLKLGFAVAQAALAVAGCLGLAAGAAAASGVNLRSVALDIVDTIVEPLPLSAEPLQDTAALDPAGQGAGDDSAAGVDGYVDGDGAATPPDAGDGAASEDTNPPAQVDPSDQTIPPGNSPPGNNPAADDLPRDENQGGPHGTQPVGTGPPPTPAPGGPPDGNGHGGQPGHNGPNDGQPGQNGPNGDGSSGGGPNGNGSSSGGPNGNGSSGSNPGPGGKGGKGGPN